MMSFRRFMVLLRNLSGESATVARLREGDDFATTPDGRRDRLVTVESPEAAELAFKAAFAPPAPPSS